MPDKKLIEEVIDAKAFIISEVEALEASLNSEATSSNRDRTADRAWPMKNDGILNIIPGNRNREN